MSEPHPRNPELEAAILEAPDSPDAYLVYGDWLIEHGDPVGELVTVQASLAKLERRAGKAKEKNALRKREKALRAEAELRLGALGAHEHTWGFGFVESLIVPEPTAETYETILGAPATRFLRELDIEDIARSRSQDGTQPTIALLARRGLPVATRKLALLSESHRRIDLGRIPAALWPQLANIEELTIAAARLDPGKIVLPRLVTFALTIALDATVVDALETAEVPLLASVQLAAEEIDARSTVTAARLEPLLAGWARAGTLRHLGIVEHRAGDTMVASMLQSGVVAKLTSLDLSRTAMTDIGGMAILENARAFEHLESLNLAENDLSMEMETKLERRFELIVDIENQGGRYDVPED